MKPIFVIPARGGSKGIPRKNIKDFCGKPLIAWTLQAALEVSSPDRVIVSTDDPDIADVARDMGVEVPWLRPAHLSTDTAGSREVVLHAMDMATEARIDFDCVVLLQPTSPLRTAADIRACMDLYQTCREDAGDIDMVVSVTEADANPYYNLFEKDPATGVLHISKGDGSITRRQNAPKVYEYNGAVYVINPDSVRRMPLGEFPRRIPCVMPRERSVDLDTPLDWRIAETIFSEQQ